MQLREAIERNRLTMEKLCCINYTLPSLYHYRNHLFLWSIALLTITNFNRLFNVDTGSAGAVVANRLSSNPNVTVLLIEAGGADDHPHIRIPAAAIKLQEPSSEYNWRHQILSQSNSHKAMINQVGNWPRGKCLGGSSSLNYMLWVRGSPADYDRWVDEGASGIGITIYIFIKLTVIALHIPICVSLIF